MTEKTRELAKNTVIIMIGKICTQFLNYFLLPLFTALLTTEQYGTADLYLNYTPLFVPLVTMQLDMGLFRFLIDARQDKAHQQKLISSGLFCVAVQCALCVGVYLILNQFWNNANLIYLLLNIIIASLVAMLQQASRGFGDNTGYAISSFLAASVQIGTNLLLICGLGWRTEAMFIAFFCGHAACAGYLAIRMKLWQFIGFRYCSWSDLKSMLSYSVPLVPNQLSWWMVGTADRTIVNLFLGASANGLLAISHKFATLYTTGINIFAYPWTESAALHFNDPDRDAFFKSVIYTMFRLFFSACIGMIAVLPFMFPFFVDADFHDAYYQIPIYLLAAFMNTIVGLYSVVFQATKQTKYAAMTSILAALVSVAADLLLIGTLKLYAPATASLIAYTVFAAVRYKDANKYIHVPLERRIVISGSVVLVLCLIPYYVKNWLLRCLGLLLAVIYAVVVNLGFLKKKLKRKA